MDVRATALLQGFILLAFQHARTEALASGSFFLFLFLF